MDSPINTSSHAEPTLSLFLYANKGLAALDQVKTMQRGRNSGGRDRTIRLLDWYLVRTVGMPSVGVLLL